MYGLQLASGIELGGSPGNLGHISSLGGLSIGFFAAPISPTSHGRWQSVS
jgi:hypothetical protein